MVLLIKILVALAIVVLLKIFLWQSSKTHPFHSRVRRELGENAAKALLYSSFLLISLSFCIMIFSFPETLGFIIGGVLGLLGTFFAM